MIDLFKPYHIGKLRLRNRFVRSATWDGTADKYGMVTDASVALFETLGKGGIGLIVTGFAFVAASGKAIPGQYGVHSDATIPGLRHLVSAVHRHRGKIALQIHHGGLLYAGTRQPARVVSEIPEIERKQLVMSEEDIENLINGFVNATLRARETGFDAVQFHGAHGYLMNQFISPVLNRRTDRWGGSIENRSRFHIEVIRRSRQAVGADFPLLLKFGVPAKSGKGLTFDDSLWTTARMCEAGIDAIEVSADGSELTPRPAIMNLRRGETERAFFREQTAAVKNTVNVPVILVGGIRSLALASEIVNGGEADLIAMSRPFIREPGILKRWQKNANGTTDCISCNRCLPPKELESGVVVCRKKKSPGG